MRGYSVFGLPIQSLWHEGGSTEYVLYHCPTLCNSMQCSIRYVSLFYMQAQNAKELWLLVEALDPVSDCYLWAEVSSVFLSPVVYIYQAML